MMATYRNSYKNVERTKQVDGLKGTTRGII